MRDITEAGVREITRRINTGEISASETAAAFVEKAAAHSELNAFVRLVNKPATPVDGWQFIWRSHCSQGYFL